MSEMGLCEYCVHKYMCMAEEPCRSCSSNQGAFEFDMAKHDAKVMACAIDEYSSKLWQAIEKLTVNCKLDLNIDDLRNLEIIIKGLAEEVKEQKNEHTRTNTDS